MNLIADSKEGTPVAAVDPAVTGKVPTLADLATPELDAALLRASYALGLSDDERTELRHLRYLLLLAGYRSRVAMNMEDGR